MRRPVTLSLREPLHTPDTKRAVAVRRIRAWAPGPENGWADGGFNMGVRIGRICGDTPGQCQEVTDGALEHNPHMIQCLHLLPGENSHGM